VLFSTTAQLDLCCNRTDYYGGKHDVFLFEIATGAITLETLNQTYIKPDDWPENETVPYFYNQLSWSCQQPSISGDYRWLVMSCLVASNSTQIVLRDRSTDATPIIVSRTSNDEWFGIDCHNPKITNNGRFGTFHEYSADIRTSNSPLAAVTAFCRGWNSPANNLGLGLYPDLADALVLFDLSLPVNSPDRIRVIRPPAYHSGWYSPPTMIDAFMPIDYHNRVYGGEFFVAFNFIPPFQLGERVCSFAPPLQIKLLILASTGTRPCLCLLPFPRQYHLPFH